MTFKRVGDQRLFRSIAVPEGLGPISELKAEIEEYWDVLLGRKESPYNVLNVESLMEVANCYYVRACEITSLILEGERVGSIKRGSEYYKFRTGELKMFLEASRHAEDLGSRRITLHKSTVESERIGR